MAATDGPASSARGRLGSVLAAALALPGVALAQLETGPGPGLVSFRGLWYQDSQPGFERVRVVSPSMLLRVPLGERWGVEGTLTTDSVSGASPRYHTAVSGASRLSDERRGGDVLVTRYGERGAWSLGAAASDENDFHSRAVSVQGRWSSEDNNTTWNAGAAYTRDRISSRDDPDLAGQRRAVELTVGVTQALSRSDLVQLGLTVVSGEGHYSDPYKRPDVRPRERRQTIAALRWNHHFEDWATTLRTSYRYYRDSFGVRSHTLLLEPVLPLGEKLTLSPTLRLYTQRAASFYFDPVYSYVGAPYPPGYFEGPPGHLSADQRLSAFGAVTVGVKLALQWDQDWSTDIKFERYEQRGAWRVGGPGSPGLAPFSAHSVQWGVARRF